MAAAGAEDEVALAAAGADDEINLNVWESATIDNDDKLQQEISVNTLTGHDMRER